MSYLNDPHIGQWTMFQVFDRGALAFECQRCWRFAQVDVQSVVNRCGIAATIDDVGRRIVCRACHSRAARVLVRLHGVRGDKAWRPSPPRAGR